MLRCPSRGPGHTRGVCLLLGGNDESQKRVTLKYTAEATHIPEISAQPLKEISYFSPIVSFLWHIFLGLQVFERYFSQEYLCLALILFCFN